MLLTVKVCHPRVKRPVLGPEIIIILLREEIMQIPDYTNRQTAWSRVHSKKLIVSCLVKKFSAVYGTRKFIIVFTSALHFSLSWARWIQSTPPSYLFKIYCVILSFHQRLGLSSDSFFQVSPPKFCLHYYSSPSKLHVPSISFARITFCETFKSLSCVLYTQFAPPFCYWLLYVVSIASWGRKLHSFLALAVHLYE
jgi:hypothetical protein